MNKRQSGFTLVEIAIVLVIIGLLLGGVLKGQEMIANAKFKNLMSDVKAYQAAYYTFQDRFHAVPGDLTQANAQAQLNAASPGSTATDGRIAGGVCNSNTDESCMAWQQLRYANMIPGNPTLQGNAANPTHAYGARVYGMFYSTAYGRSGNYLYLENIPGDVAQRLDREMDDGTGSSGTVFCVNGCTGGAYPITGAMVQVAVYIG